MSGDDGGAAPTVASAAKIVPTAQKDVEDAIEQSFQARAVASAAQAMPPVWWFTT